MSHWDDCDAIERHPDRVSGAWIFKDTRLPVAALFAALEDSPTIDDCQCSASLTVMFTVFDRWRGSRRLL